MGLLLDQDSGEDGIQAYGHEVPSGRCLINGRENPTFFQDSREGIKIASAMCYRLMYERSSTTLVKK